MPNAKPLLQNPPVITTNTGINTTQTATNEAIQDYLNQLNNNALSSEEMLSVLSDFKELDLLPDTGATTTVTKDDLGKVFEIDVTGGAKTVLFPVYSTINPGFNFSVVEPNGAGSPTNKIICDGNGKNIRNAATLELTNPDAVREFYYNGVKWIISKEVN